MRFDELTAHLDRLEQTSSRNELVRILSEVYAQSAADEIQPATYLIQGRLAPFFEPVEIGLGERLILTAMESAYGIDKVELQGRLRELGDLGLTARALAPERAGPGPDVVDVHTRLSEIADLAGTDPTDAPDTEIKD